MNAAAGLDLLSIPDRIQSEVQRAIQRSIKGVEYLSSSGPSLGSTPKDILDVRGTMNLYHYRPVATVWYDRKERAPTRHHFRRAPKWRTKATTPSRCGRT